MNINRLVTLVRKATMIGLTIVSLAPPASAGAKDYEFQPVATNVKNRVGSEVAVRLIDKQTAMPEAFWPYGVQTTTARGLTRSCAGRHQPSLPLPSTHVGL